jgi:predicted MFS family arabinose efflux permease
MSAVAVARRERAPGYRHLLLVPGFGRLAVATLCSRIALSMGQVAVLLLVLQRYRSPGIAGLALCLSIGPGLLASPLAGALLDRHDRIRLIRLDYLTASACLLLIACLAWAGRLSPWVLLTALAVASVTAPLSDAGTRALLPQVVPTRMWDKANAVDSGGYVVASVVGPPVSGVLVAAGGGTVAILATALLHAVAALTVSFVQEPPRRRAIRTALFAGALDGLGYVVRHPTLRGLALSVSLRNVGCGVLMVGLPALVLQRLHQSPSVVGLLFAVLGVAGVLSGVVSGSRSTAGRERNLLVGGIAGSAVGLAVIASAHSAGHVLAGMTMIGLATGPLDVSLFSLRQRRTDVAVQGRAFAVSMALNYLGLPVGAALAGPLVVWSAGGALGLAAMTTAVAAALGLLLVPREGAPLPRDAASTVAGGGDESGPPGRRVRRVQRIVSSRRHRGGEGKLGMSGCGSR